MSLLYNVVFSSRCTSNHHRLAVDALRHLAGPDAEKWRDALLVHHPSYLEGAKAPDVAFKDFKNHVLHVKDDYWGGAPDAAALWYQRTVEALRAKTWKTAAYNAGVMSHYLVDPIQPFHTGQTETENVIHRAVEQSFSKSYAAFQDRIAADGGYRDIALPDGADWVRDTVRAGAEASNPFYGAIIDHYDFKRGAKNPPAGLDDALRDAIAPLIARAAVTIARVLDRAFAEAGVKPPFVVASLDGFFAQLTTPIQWVANKMADSRERALVMAMYKEFQKTGKVDRTLPEDDRQVRALYAAEIRNVPVERLGAEPVGPIGRAHGQPLSLVSGSPTSQSASSHALGSGSPQSRSPGSRSPDSRSPTPGVVVAQPAAARSPAYEAAASQAPPVDAGKPGADRTSRAKTSAGKAPPAKAKAEKPNPGRAEPSKASARPVVDAGAPEPATAARPARKRAAPKAGADARAPKVHDPDSPFAVLANHGVPAAAGDTHAPIADDHEIAPPPPPGVRLHRDDLIIDAPAIGPKAAARFEAIGFKTVADLLEATPEEVAKSLRASHMTPPIIRDWQAQALLACTLPNVRSIDAQALVANDIRDAGTLARQDAVKLTASIDAYLKTPAGKQMARSSKPPNLETVRAWIEAAQRTPPAASVAA